MHAAILVLIWICVVVFVILLALAVAGIAYIFLLIKRAGFTDLFRRLSNRRR